MSVDEQPIVAIDTGRLAHVVISASAGSGKTHELSGRYLSLVAAGERPSRILASTFTRVAAGEIRDRLLRRLALAVLDEDKRADLATSLGVNSISMQQSLAMLRRLVQNLHVLQIRTLDSFFSSVVRAYAIELGLPQGCEVVDDSEDKEIRHEAMRLMLDETDPQTIIEPLRLLTRGDSDRSVTEAIDGVVAGLYELWRESDAHAWDWISPPSGLLSSSDLQRAVESLLELALPTNKNIVKARNADVDAVIQRDWERLVSKGIAGVVAHDKDTYYNTTLGHDVIEAYRPIVRHAMAELVHAVREQTLATRALIMLFDEQYRQLKRSRRALTFSDLTHAMVAARVGLDDQQDGLGALDVVGYRLDASIHHLLLDEFQDTSGAQWRALRGMAQEITSQLPPERTFFCVGDVKQSIYGWREANPDVLAMLQHRLPGVSQRRLDRSWRSSPVIINAVNNVFDSIASNPALIGEEPFHSAAEAWQREFSTHDVAEHLRNEPGYVEIRTLPDGADGNSSSRLMRRIKSAAELVARLHQRDSALRIGVLTRTNASVARMLFELGPSGCNVPASGRGGGPLIDAPPVTVVLDALQLADHPDDTIAAFNVAMSPLGPVVGLHDHRDAGRRRRVARAIRERLMLEGYQRTIADWVSRIASDCEVRELRRLRQLVELAGTHDSGSGASLRTAAFIQAVESTSVPDVQPAPVEVMTIHQSKGMEFDAVVLPDLGAKLRGARNPLVVFERDEHGAVSSIARPGNKAIRACLPKLQRLWEATGVRAVRESLSLLYVAMTRARNGLYVLIDPPKQNEQQWPRTLAGVIRGALCPQLCSAGAVVYSSGDEHWMEHRAGRRSTPSVVIPQPERSATVIRLKPTGDGASRPGAAVAASKARERHRARAIAGALREHLQLTDPEGRERGSVIHALFECIEWIEHFTHTDDGTLMSVCRRNAPRRDEQWHRRQIKAFRAMIAKPAISAALSLGGRSPASVVVHREWPYVRLTNSGLQSGIIDRLVLEHDERGQLTAAMVIDFKTDAITEHSHVAQAETHREQLENYRDAVAEVFAIDPRAVSMQVLLVGAGAAIML